VRHVPGYTVFCNIVKATDPVFTTKNTVGASVVGEGNVNVFDPVVWADLEKNCIELRLAALNLNAEFFPSEEKGLQSWAIGDMCGLLWNLWKKGLQVQCPDELDFNWASTPIEEYDKHAIFHNAGVSGKWMEMNGEKVKMFHKGDIRLRTSSLTFFDLTYQDITDKYCTCKYVEAIMDVKDPICITKRTEY